MTLLDKLKGLLWGGADEDALDDGERPDRSEEDAVPSCVGKVVLVRPDFYINVGLLTSYLCAGYLVLMDLSGVTPQGRRRIVDFLSGAAYSRDGILMQVSAMSYLLAPSTVDIRDWSELRGEDWEYQSALNF